MGTGVISSIFFVTANLGVAEPLTKTLSLVFLVLAILVAVPIMGITTWRFIRYPKVVAADLANPVKGAMSVTYAGGFLVLAVGFGRAGMTLFGPELATFLTFLFTAIGGTLAIAIGLIFLSGIFARGDVPVGMISGAWFIPPVVTIIVPIALAPVLQGQTPLTNELYWLSWAFIGIGSLLYLAIVAVLFYRSATMPLPPAALAPSLIIGMGPAGLIGFDLWIMADIGANVGIDLPALTDLAAMAGTAFWGFGLWWAVASAMVIRAGYGLFKLPFSLSWWGWTFPLGAWVVSGLHIGAQVGSYIVMSLSALGGMFLLGVWVTVVILTVKGLVKGTIWEH